MNTQKTHTFQLSPRHYLFYDMLTSLQMYVAGKVNEEERECVIIQEEK